MLARYLLNSNGIFAMLGVIKTLLHRVRIGFFPVCNGKQRHSFNLAFQLHPF